MSLLSQNYLEIFYSSNIHALVFGDDDLNPVASVLNGTTKSCDHVPQTSHLGYWSHLTSNVHNMISWPAMKNNFKQYKYQNLTIFSSRILVNSTTDINRYLLVMCTCSRFFSSLKIQEHNQKESKMNSYLSFYLSAATGVSRESSKSATRFSTCFSGMAR